MTLVLYILALWLIPAVMSYGILLAQSDAMCPTDHRANVGMSVLMGILLGILSYFGVFIALCFSGFAQHGFKAR